LATRRGQLSVVATSAPASTTSVVVPEDRSDVDVDGPTVVRR
jgi:hypothetical protein